MTHVTADQSAKPTVDASAKRLGAVSTLVLACAGQFLAVLDLFVVNTAFPQIRADFPGTTNVELSWVLNAYGIAFAASLVPAGSLADHYGRRRLFRLGMSVFALASIGCATSPWLGLLVAWRVAQGIGAALLVPTSLGLLLANFPAARHRSVIAIWSASGGIAAACGPPLGGLLVQADWRWIFLMNVPVAVLVVVFAGRVGESRRAVGGPLPDLVGAAVFAVSIAAMTAAIANVNDWGWASLRLWGCIVVGVAAVVVFLRRSARHPQPAINLKLLRTRQFAWANLSMLCFFAGFAMLLLGGVLYLAQIWHYSSIRAGLGFAPGPGVAIVSSLLGARLRLSRRWLAGIGAAAFAVTGVLWRLSLGPDASYAATYLPGLLVAGLGFGLFLASIIGAGTAVLPADQYAAGTGMINTSRQIGSAAGVALLVALVGAGASATDFQVSWLLISCFAVVAAALALALEEA